MFIIIIIFLLGLAVGSALNALVYRLDKKKSWIFGYSICPSCKHKLSWRDLFPVLSFLFLRGHCRYCQKKISLQYPIIEIATGVIFVLVYLVNPITQFSIINLQSAILGTNLLITAVLILIFVYDLKHYLILDKVVLPAIIIVFFINIYLGRSVPNMLLASFSLSIFFLLQFLISKGKWIGGGDIRLGFFMGIILGWPQALLALFLSYLFGSVIGIFLILFKLKSWRSQLPFAAFLVPGTLVAMLWGEKLLNWYLSIF